MSKKEDLLKSLTFDVRACTKCPLSRIRDQPTISRGNPNSPLVIVGDYPRDADHKSGKSFSGLFGKKLDSFLVKAGIQPDTVYITTLLKCFIGKMSYFPTDNSPGKCFSHLATQLKIVKPLIVVVSGIEALQWVLLRGSGAELENIDDWVGPLYRRRAVYGELKFGVMPHPAQMYKEKNKELEAKCVKLFEMCKDYIKKKQSNLPTGLLPTDIEEKPILHRKEQIGAFKWVKPDVIS